MPNAANRQDNSHGGPDPKHNIEAAREEFYQRISKRDMAPLWKVMSSVVTKEPVTRCVPHVWHYDDVKSLVMESGGLITAEEALRRVLILENPALRGVVLVDAHDPVAKSADQNSMLPDIAYAGLLAVRIRVKAVSRMRGDQLQRETAGSIRVAATLPTREIPVEGGTFRIFGLESAQGLGDEFEFSGLRRQSLAEFIRILRRQRDGFRHVLGLAFGKPSHVDGRSRGLGSGMNDLIALLQKVLPAHELRQVRGIENAFAPIELGAASFREQGTQS